MSIVPHLLTKITVPFYGTLNLLYLLRLVESQYFGRRVVGGPDSVPRPARIWFRDVLFKKLFRPSVILFNNIYLNLLLFLESFRNLFEFFDT